MGYPQTSPETARRFVNYYSWVLEEFPDSQSNPSWKEGLRIATLWLEIHERDSVTTKELEEFYETVEAFSREGNGSGAVDMNLQKRKLGRYLLDNGILERD